MSVLNQRDPQWAGVKLGYGPATIGEAGCLLTAFAQVARHYGLSTNPLDLNRIFMQQNKFVQGDLLADEALNSEINGVHFVTKWDFSRRPADLSVLTNNFEDEYIIEIDFDHNPNDGIQTHFVRFVSWDGHTLVIDDPWFGTEENFADHYGADLATTILKITKYTGPGQPAAAPVSTPTLAAYTPLVKNLHAAPAGAHVRVLPDVNSPLATNPSIPGGTLNGGQQFNVIGFVHGNDGFVWYVTIHHNYVRSDATLEGNSALPAGAGGGEAEAPAEAPAEAVAEPVAEPEVPAAPEEAKSTGQAEGTIPVKVEPSVVEVPRTWIKDSEGANLTTTLAVKANEAVKAEHGHEGSYVYDLSKTPVEGVEIVPVGTELPFVAYLTVDDKHYFQTQHIIDEGLEIGIEGTDLAFPETKDEAPAESPEPVQPEAPANSGLKKAVGFLDHLSGNKNKEAK